MNGEFPTRAVAACFSLACFSVAIVAGLIADRSASSILSSALVALLVGQVIGLIGALVIAHAIRQGVEMHIKGHPIPDSLGSLRNPRAVDAGGNAPGGSAGT